MAHHRSVIRREARRRNRSKKTSMAHTNRYRLVVYRSLKHFEAQVVDDLNNNTIVSASSRETPLTETPVIIPRRRPSFRACLSFAVPREGNTRIPISVEVSSVSVRGLERGQEAIQWGTGIYPRIYAGSFCRIFEIVKNRLYEGSLFYVNFIGASGGSI